MKSADGCEHSLCNSTLGGYKLVCYHHATRMIEVEVYAAGVRSLEKILALDHELEAVPSLRYKIDSNHDIVYLDFDVPTLTIDEIHAIFSKLKLEARIVGNIPAELNQKSKTQLLSAFESPGAV